MAINIELAELAAKAEREARRICRERGLPEALWYLANEYIARLTRELEEARERERHIEGQIVALVEAEVISEGKAREILGIGVEEWREIEDRALAKDTEVSDGE